MMKKSNGTILMRLIAAAAVGLALGVLRMREWTGQELLLLGAGAAVLLTLAALFGGTQAGEEKALMPARLVLMLSALPMAAAGAFGFLRSETALMRLLMLLFPMACAAAALLRGLHGDRDRLSALFTLFPVFYFCIMLLMFYRANARVADLLSYSFETAAIAVMLLGLYLLSAVRFGTDHPKLRTAVCMMGAAAGTMEGMIALLDRWRLWEIGGYNASLLLMMLGAAGLLFAGLIDPGMRSSPVRETSAAQSDEEVMESDEEFVGLMSELPELDAEQSADGQPEQSDGER